MITEKKKVFGHAKRRVAAAALAAVIPFSSMLAVHSAGGGYAVNNQANYIGEAQAKTIAFTHAGVAESQTTNLRVRLDVGRKSSDYDIDFYVENVEYEYEIDAVTGYIKEYDREVKRQRPGSGGGSRTNAPSPVATPSPAVNVIGDAQAKSIALNRVGVAETQATAMRVRLDRGRNSSKYEVDFSVGTTRYEIELDASTGQILEFNQETKRNGGSYGQTAPNPANYIGETQAKAIALSHAGVSESQTTYLRIVLDWDRKGADYEIKFNVGDTRYEYEIAAESGAILDCDQKYTRPATTAPTTPTTPTTPVTPPVVTTPPAQQPASPSTYIGENAAKSIALNAAGFAESQVQKLKVKLDREHKVMVYEVEFRNGRYEYEYDIDAVTGAIVKSEFDD